MIYQCFDVWNAAQWNAAQCFEIWNAAQCFDIWNAAQCFGIWNAAHWNAALCLMGPSFFLCLNSSCKAITPSFLNKE